MSKKLYSKNRYYQTIICEVCNEPTDAVHAIYAYHMFPKENGGGILRRVPQCQRCWAESGLKSSKQIWVPMNRSTGRSSHFIETNERKEAYHGSFG